MISKEGAKSYRAAAEQEARAAAARRDWEVYTRALGKVTALDFIFSDEEDLALAVARIPFPTMNLPGTSPPRIAGRSGESRAGAR
jgi:hypothetical protein